MASEGEPPSEESSGSGCWSPEQEGSSEGSPAGCKLFIFNLARTVTDTELQQLFAPFSPIYCCVAIGKKGTSRRFGFAKFSDPDTAQAALAATKGAWLHGKEVDVKVAIAVAEPDPRQGVEAKLRAKLREAAAKDASPRIAAGPPAVAAAQTPLSSQPAEAARQLPQPLPLPLPLVPATAAPSSTMPAQVAEAPLPVHHLVVMRHGKGWSHERIVQHCWCFRPLNISTTIEGGEEKSFLLFGMLQQAHAAQEAIMRSDPDAASLLSLVSIPLHVLPEHPVLPPDMQQAGPQLYQPPPAHQVVPALVQPQMPPPAAARPPLMLRGAAQPFQPPTAQPQQQPQPQSREPATMRPLYAVPGGPGFLMRPVIMPPRGYQPYQHTAWQPASIQVSRLAPAAPRPPVAPMAPPPYHHLNFAVAPWAAEPGRPLGMAVPLQQEPPTLPAPAPSTAPAGALASLPETLSDGLEPGSPKRLNPAAPEFAPKPSSRSSAAASGAGAGAPQQQQGPPVMITPVVRSIVSSIEAALAGRSFVPAWDRLQQRGDPGAQGQLAEGLVVAEALEYDSGTEDEGEHAPEAREVYAAVSAWNINMCMVTRSVMRLLQPVEIQLKQTAIGDPAAAPSLLTGAVVRVLIDKTYKLRLIQSTYIKPESGRLMLVLHDVNSPIPADHISNTNPLAAAGSSSAPVAGSQGEAELLELQAKLAFHGRRLFRHEVAAAAWQLQFAAHWQSELGGKTGDELRLATSHLRAMLQDEDEIRWRRRGVHGLDLAKETAMVASSFKLSWNAAANWMAQSSPSAKLVPAVFPGGSPRSAERSNITGDYITRQQLAPGELLGLQRSERLLPCRAARRSLLRAAADPVQHEQFMADLYSGQRLPAQARQLANGEAAPAAAAPAPSSSASVGAPSEAPSLDMEADPAAGQKPGCNGDDEDGRSAGLQSCDSEVQLLAEAATFGASTCSDGAGLPDFFASGLKLHSSPQKAAAPHEHGGGDENASRQAGGGGAAGRASTKVAAVAAAALQRSGSGRIPAVHTASRR